MKLTVPKFAGFAILAALGSPCANAAQTLDGLYDGSGNVSSGRCSPPQVTKFQVTNNHISRGMGSTWRVDANVGPDGTITNGNAAIGTVTKGSITGGKLVMDVSLTACSYHYELTRTP